MLKKVRVLGVDPGFGRIGFAVVEKNNNDLNLISCGCIETPSKSNFLKRLDFLNKSLKKIIIKYQPDISAVEELFFYKNLKTAIQVGQARGVILLTLQQANLKILEFTPLQVKQSLTGYGRAEKQQIQYMVSLILKLGQKRLQDDAADAIAVALTAINSLKFNNFN